MTIYVNPNILKGTEGQQPFASPPGFGKDISQQPKVNAALGLQAPETSRVAPQYADLPVGWGVQNPNPPVGQSPEQQEFVSSVSKTQPNREYLPLSAFEGEGEYSWAKEPWTNPFYPRTEEQKQQYYQEHGAGTNPLKIGEILSMGLGGGASTGLTPVALSAFGTQGRLAATAANLSGSDAAMFGIVPKDYVSLTASKVGRAITGTPSSSNVIRAGVNAGIAEIEKAGVPLSRIVRDSPTPAEAQKMVNFIGWYAGRLSNPNVVVSDAEIAGRAAELVPLLERNIDQLFSWEAGKGPVANMRKAVAELGSNKRMEQITGIERVVDAAHRYEPSILRQIFGVAQDRNAENISDYIRRAFDYLEQRTGKAQYFKGVGRFKTGEQGAVFPEKFTQLNDILEKWVYGNEAARLYKVGTEAAKYRPAISTAETRALTGGIHGESAVEVAGTTLKGANPWATRKINDTLQEVKKILGKYLDVVDNVINRFWILQRMREVKIAKPTFQVNLDNGAITTVADIDARLAAIRNAVGNEAYNAMDQAVRKLSATSTELLMKSQEKSSAFKAFAAASYKYYYPMIKDEDKIKLAEAYGHATSFVRGLGEQAATLKSPFEVWTGSISKRVLVNAENEFKLRFAKATQFAPSVRDYFKIFAGKEAPPGNCISFYENGVKKWLQFGPEVSHLYLDMINYLEPGKGIVNPNIFAKIVGWLEQGGKWLSSLQNISRRGFTSLSPMFFIKNTIADPIALLLGEGIGPRGYIKALVESIKDIAGKSKVAKTLGEAGYMMGGGEIVRALEVSPAKIINGKNQWAKWLNPLEIMRVVNETTEKTPRIATGMKYLEAGETAAYASMRARRVTVDFDAFSLLSRSMNNLWLFSNAGKLGFQLPFKIARENPRAFAGKIALLIGSVLGIAAWNHQYKSYYEISLQDRSSSIIIMTGEHTDQKGRLIPHYVRLIPVLREWSMFTFPFVYVFDTIYKEHPEDLDTLMRYIKNPQGKFETKEAAQAWQNAWSPLSAFVGEGGNMPVQVIKAAEQWRRNYDDYLRKSIVPEDLIEKPLPQQFDETTPTVYVLIGQATGQSPMQLEHFINTTLGGSARESAALIDQAINLVYKKDLDPVVLEHVQALKNIVTPGKDSDTIQLERSNYLSKLSKDMQDKVLGQERVKEDRLPFLTALVNVIYKEGPGGATYYLARKQALETRQVASTTPVEELSQSALENATKLKENQITKKAYDTQRTYYRAYYSGGSNQVWQGLEQKGYIAGADVRGYLPAGQKGPTEFQAMDEYYKLLDEIGNKANFGVGDTALNQIRQKYGEAVATYITQHKDDWIANLPPVAQEIEKMRSQMIDDDTWYKNYDAPLDFTKSPSAPSDYQRMLLRNLKSQVKEKNQATPAR